MAERRIESADVAVDEAPVEAHLLLQCRPEDAPALAAAISLPLADRMLRTSGGEGWSALHLAPDEWLLIGPEADAGRIVAAAAGAGAAHALVDVSDRSQGFDLAGPGAALVLASGCPLDLADAAFPVGACSRTLFGKAPAMIWRRDHTAYRIEVWRSFAEYTAALLATAAAAA